MMAVLSLLPLVALLGLPMVQGQDPCAKIASQQWTTASDVRACYQSFPYDPVIKANIVEVINKTMNFHTSTNYVIQAPSPFDDVQLDIKAELARISAQTYQSDFEMHLDIAQTTRKMGDGHSVYVNMCYDSTYLSYVPVPVVLLEDPDGKQNIYIDPVAWNIFIQGYFRDSGQVDKWQAALGDIPFRSLPGAKVISINNADPWEAVNANAKVAGSYQSFATRQNGFFSGHTMAGYDNPYADSEFAYLPGHFSQKALPLEDSVTMTIHRVNQSSTETITLPYLSRFHDHAVAFTDGASFWKNNCLLPTTNNAKTTSGQVITQSQSVSHSVASRFGVQPFRNTTNGEITMVNSMIDVLSAPHIPMPLNILPGRVEFYIAHDIWGWMLNDNKTAVFALGSFSCPLGLAQLYVVISYLMDHLAEQNATRLIIDVSNNQGGCLCAAAYLHYALFGQKVTTDPQALLPTRFRANPLAQNVVDKVISTGVSPDVSRYHPSNHKNAQNNPFSDSYNYLSDNVLSKTINGRNDTFSQLIGQECQPMYLTPPPQPVWTGEIVLASNGRCASTCALFASVLAKEENVKVVSIGGVKDTPQQYAGTVGGESLDYSEIDREIKVAGLKDDPLAPPDFITNSYQGITWRLAQSPSDLNEPEEYESREADMNFQLTAEIVNRPYEVWNALATKVFG